MKKRQHNSRSVAAAGVDPRALDEAAALLVRAIAAQLKQYPATPAPAPKKSGARRKAIERAVGRETIYRDDTYKGGESVRVPQAPPATYEEAVKIAARLVVLGGACSDLCLPLRLAAGWLPLADVAAFADRAEEHVRALVELYEQYLAANPGALERCSGDRTDLAIEIELGAAKKGIASLAKIADGSAVLDIGRNYLPPEYRPPADPPHHRWLYENEGDAGEGDER